MTYDYKVVVRYKGMTFLVYSNIEKGAGLGRLGNPRIISPRSLLLHVDSHAFTFAPVWPEKAINKSETCLKGFAPVKSIH